VGAHFGKVGGGDRTRKVKGGNVENTMQGGDQKNRAAPGGGGVPGGGLIRIDPGLGGRRIDGLGVLGLGLRGIGDLSWLLGLQLGK
jgi:hypothetical protein